jgi:hypothetical protein
MQSKKIILIIVLIIVVIGVLFFGLKTSAPKAEIPTEKPIAEKIIATSTPVKVQPVSIKDTAWAVFQKYLDFNKNHDLDGVKNSVYKVNVVCASSTITDECKNRMDSAYAYGIALNKKDFKNVWSDSKQIILATDFWTESIKELDEYGRFRSLIFFVRGVDNKWKLLSFSPTKGNGLSKASSTQEEIDAKLISYTEDNDKDGIADFEESREQTNNPALRDTDGDGFWDGVQALMK